MRALFMGLLLLTACSQPATTVWDESNPFQSPSVGDRVRLLEPIKLPPETTRMFLQNGELMVRHAFDQYQVHCNFEVRTLLSEPQTIQPDEFIISRVQALMVDIVKREQPARGGLMRVSMDDGGATMVTRGYHLWLDSEQQPDVMRLSCRGAFDTMPYATPPSIQEIRQALGSYARLVTNPAEAGSQ
ncbi:MAG: hypothetical protein ABW076_05595 [Candidatus Thiodiazotropha sp.]